MTKQELTTAILKDMYTKKGDSETKETVDKRWKAWLSRQSKNELAQIYTNRRIGK